MQSAAVQSVESHYARRGLVEAILEGVRASGLDPDRLAPDDLAAVDEFHTRGRQATEELVQLARPRAGQRILDVGCGLGGTARHLAARHGVEVVGVDATPEYCRAAGMLTDKTGLADRVEIVTADALSLPFGDGAFDQVWTEHVTMNIADKPRLYAELRRVLRRGGRLALHEILAGPGGDVHFPVPWARHPEISHLATPEQLRRAVEEAGFEVNAWLDVTSPALVWFEERAAIFAADTKPALGLHLLMGPHANEMFSNQVRNLQENRIGMVQAVAEAR